MIPFLHMQIILFAYANYLICIFINKYENIENMIHELGYRYKINNISAAIRQFYPQANTLRLHLTLTLWVQCIVHLRSTF